MEKKQAVIPVLTGKHYVALRDCDQGTDWVWDPEPEVARLSQKERWALVGKADHELIEEVAEHYPTYVLTGPPMGGNPKAVLGALLIQPGHTAVDAYFAQAPFTIEPQSTHLLELTDNYNQFVGYGTQLDLIDPKLFADCCLRNADFKRRWAPKLVLS